MQRISGYHAHVYFDASTIGQARALCEQATQLFALKMGRVHERPVGPHPDWSCQLAFEPQVLGDVLPWLALNRNGLVVFLHLTPATICATTPSTPSGWARFGRWTCLFFDQSVSSASPGKCSSRCSHGKRLSVQMCRSAGACSGWSRVAMVRSMVPGLRCVTTASCAPQ